MNGSEQDAHAWPQGPAREGLLAGVRVLDLSRILAGPFATMQLADLGADVLKVESPQGDETRRWGPPFTEDGTAAYFFGVNRNKRSVTLDLSEPEARGTARALAAAADIVIDNFLPGRMERFGLDHGSVSAANPRVVTCTITGYGSDTDWAGVPGFDFLAQAMGGLMAITGPQDGDPTKTGVAIADLLAGLYATSGVLAALHRREATGRGSHVEVSLLDAVVGSLANQGSGYLATGREPRRLGNAHPSIVPYETFAASDGPVAMGVGTDRQFARLAGVLGLAGLAEDPRFATNADRVAHRAELKRILEDELGQHPRDHWLELLRGAGVPASPVNTLGEVFADPLVRDRLVDVSTGSPQIRSPLRVDGRPAPVHTAPPALGQHNDEVRRALSGSTREPAGAVRVAVGQFAPVTGALDENLSAVRELIASAADAGARLLVLPEYSLSGYDQAWVKDGAPGGGSDIGGEAFAGLARACAHYGISVVMGELERSGGQLYSTSVVLSAGKIAGVHRKTVVTEQEAEHGLQQGDEAASPVSLPGLPLPVGQMVCFEHGFPEIALDLALAGAGMLTISSLIGVGDEYLRDLRTRARAQDNGAYVLAANAAGGEWCGASVIVNPRGEVVARADRDTRGIVCADIDPALVARERAAEPVLRLRRPGLRPAPSPDAPAAPDAPGGQPR